MLTILYCDVSRLDYTLTYYDYNMMYDDCNSPWLYYTLLYYNISRLDYTILCYTALYHPAESGGPPPRARTSAYTTLLRLGCCDVTPNLPTKIIPSEIC